jgi:peptidoglycan hydrolase-like protein with peptidoglycan-binding domain
MLNRAPIRLLTFAFAASLAAFAATDAPTTTAPASSTHKTTTHKSSTHKSAPKTSARGKKTTKKRGQQIIDSDRARQIQQALIREHYLTGEPTGKWDATTQEAMQKYQADQGWQSKTTPDSRALIKLGLGPSKDHLLNPESAMTTAPAAASAKMPAKSDPANPAATQSKDRPQQ